MLYILYILYFLEQVMQIYMHHKLQLNQRMNQIIIVCNRQLVGKILFLFPKGITYYILINLLLAFYIMCC